MPIEFGGDILRNDFFVVETNNRGDLVQTHKQTGAQFKYDVSESAWVPVEGLYLDGADITGVESVEASEATVDSISADSATVEGTTSTGDLESGDATVEAITADSATVEGTTSTGDLESGDATVEAITADSATVEGTTTTQALEADRATIGQVADKGDVYSLIDRSTPSSAMSGLTFNNLDEHSVYRMFYSLKIGGSQDLLLRFNGDGDSTGDYDYWDETGTILTGENEIQLIDISGVNITSGIIEITTAGFNETGHISANHSLIGGNPDRINGFAEVGIKQTSEPLQSIEITSPSSFSGDNTLVELWERDYS